MNKQLTSAERQALWRKLWQIVEEVERENGGPLTTDYRENLIEHLYDELFDQEDTRL